MSNEFTPTQQAMLKVLADGRPHTRGELHTCLPDEMGSLSNIRAHICNIRKILRPKGQDILCELQSAVPHYRHVRLLGSTTNGHR